VRERYQRTHKPLKAEEILTQRSVIPAVDSRKRPSSKVADGIIGPSIKKRKKNWVSSKELQRLKDTLDESNHLSTDQLENAQGAVFDLWATNTPVMDHTTYSYLEQPKAKVPPSTVSHPPIAMTASGKPVRAVEQPNAGTSYNPSFTDWDGLLNQEGQRVVDTERKRLQKAQIEEERAARIASIASEDALSARNDDESAWEGFESEYESPEWLSKRRSERKTQPQRNKIKRRKDAERQALHQTKMADKRKQAREMEQLAKHEDGDKTAVTDQVLVMEEGIDSSEDGDDTVLRRKGLRNVAIPERNLEVVLSEELQESLRRLKPEGNLLNDRFRHLLVNGKVEARKPVVQPKKKRVTYTEKWTHKDFEVVV
jgi:Nop53 (60S ribosomal biogenesis)